MNSLLRGKRRKCFATRYARWQAHSISDALDKARAAQTRSTRLLIIKGKWRSRGGTLKDKCALRQRRVKMFRVQKEAQAFSLLRAKQQ
jgi:hypothetical protein